MEGNTTNTALLVAVIGFRKGLPPDGIVGLLRRSGRKSAPNAADKDLQ